MLFGESTSEAAAHQLLSAAAEAGINFFDSAEMYPVPQRAETQGRSEAMLGAWMKSKRRCLALAALRRHFTQMLCTGSSKFGSLCRTQISANVSEKDKMTVTCTLGWRRWSVQLQLEQRCGMQRGFCGCHQSLGAGQHALDQERPRGTECQGNRRGC